MKKDIWIQKNKKRFNKKQKFKNNFISIDLVNIKFTTIHKILEKTPVLFQIK